MKRVFCLKLMIFIIIISSISYAKYIFTKSFSITSISNDFYFSEELQNSPELIDEQVEIQLLIKNNDGVNFNLYDTNYEISLLENEKFTMNDGVIEKTISGNSLIDEQITLNLQLKDGITKFKSTEDIKLKISVKEPYQKEIIKDVSVLINNSQIIPDYTFSKETYTVRMGNYSVYRTKGATTLNGIIDVSKMNYIEFDFFVPEGYDTTKIYPIDSQLELGSAGTFDIDEINYATFYYLSENIIEGQWNHIIIPMDKVDGSTGNCDLSKINFIGLYWNNEETDPFNTYEIPNCQIKNFKFSKYIIE